MIKFKYNVGDIVVVKKIFSVDYLFFNSAMSSQINKKVEIIERYTIQEHPVYRCMLLEKQERIWTWTEDSIFRVNPCKYRIQKC